MSYNQDYVLARSREDAAKDDPPFYTVRQMCGRPFVWMNAGGNVGWYAPELKDGEVVGLRSICYPQPWPGETDRDRKAFNFAFKLVNPKQRRKLAHLLASFQIANAEPEPNRMR